MIAGLSEVQQHVVWRQGGGVGVFDLPLAAADSAKLGRKHKFGFHKDQLVHHGGVDGVDGFALLRCDVDTDFRHYPNRPVTDPGRRETRTPRDDPRGFKMGGCEGLGDLRQRIIATADKEDVSRRRATGRGPISERGGSGANTVSVAWHVEVPECGSIEP